MFTWDVIKAISNFEKHGISFEEAAAVFTDADGLHVADDKHSDKEIRLYRIGRSALGTIITVVFTIRRLSDEKETIRIISARRASKKEKKAYHGQ